MPLDSLHFESFNRNANGSMLTACRQPRKYYSLYVYYTNTPIYANRSPFEEIFTESLDFARWQTIFIYTRVPDDHLTLPSPILIEEAVEAGPDTTQIHF